MSEAEEVAGSSPSNAGEEVANNGNGSGQAAATDVSTSQKTPRLGPLAGAMESMTFIENVGKDKSLKIRVDDTRSAILMAMSLVLLLVSIWMVGENPDAKAAGITIVLIADALCGVSILWYCILRFGFIRSIEPRYAILCWHLVLGTGVLFSFIATNIMLTLFTLSRMSQ